MTKTLVRHNTSLIFINISRNVCYFQWYWKRNLLEANLFTMQYTRNLNIGKPGAGTASHGLQPGPHTTGRTQGATHALALATLTKVRGRNEQISVGKLLGLAFTIHCRIGNRSWMDLTWPWLMPTYTTTSRQHSIDFCPPAGSHKGSVFYGYFKVTSHFRENS